MAHKIRCVVLAPAIVFGMLGGTDAMAQASRPDCTGPEHRQFDFWVGDWEVTAQGGVAGTNLITLRDDGCVLHEHWKGSAGGTGESWNFYDRSTGLWHQIWIDGTGGVLRFAGRYADGRLALTGESQAPDGSPVLHKLTFFNNTTDATVKQVWEQSRDGGSTWKVVFDGLYRKRN